MSKATTAGEPTLPTTVPFDLEHANYVYKDAGETVGIKCRRLNGDGRATKKFRKGDIGISVPYRLDKVKEELRKKIRPLCIADGERDTETLLGLGCVATCAPYGMGSWNETMVRHLGGVKVVYIFVDQDGGTGMQQAEKLRDLLNRTIKPNQVILVRASVGKDIYDHYVADGGPWVWLDEDTKPPKDGTESRKRPAVEFVEEALPAALQLAVERLEAMPGVRLRKVKGDPPKWEGCCPLLEHDDRNPSFAIGQGDRVPVVVICSCGGTVAEFAAVLGMNPRDFSDYRSSSSSTDELEGKKVKLRLNREAYKAVLEEEEVARFAVPTSTLTGVEEMAIEDAPVKFRLHGALAENQIALLAAEQKGGKSTLLKNLTRDLIHGDYFLGRFAAQSPIGRVGFWNYEEHEAQWRAEARQLGLDEVGDRWAVNHLVGYPVHLETDVAASYAIDWLGEREIEIWIIDILNRAFGGNWQNDNMATYRFFDKIEEIQRVSGVKEIIISAQSSVHDRDRVGGCSALSASPGVLWTMTKKGETRFFSALGRRQIDAKEQDYSFDKATLRLGSGGGENRLAHKSSTMVLQVLEIVTAYPGINKTGIKDRMAGGRNQDFNAAIADASMDGLIRNVSDGKSHCHFMTKDGEDHLRLSK